MKQLVIAMLIIIISLSTLVIADDKQEVNDKLRASGVVGEKHMV